MLPSPKTFYHKEALVKRLSTGVLTALIVALCGLSAAAAPSPTQGNTGNSVAQASPPPADFGSPPSGQIPILFNDHHVYTKPDILKQGRVLAALVKGGTLFIPLRSMFEQMGATVSWDPGSRTATVSKPGAEVKVTVGKPEVVINGETRPLDVPPMVYNGVVLVPVRVISEGMGAYVQWVPDRHLVVVRYLPSTPPPSPAPPPPAAPPPPPPPPPPTPHPMMGEAFVAGDYIFSPSIYNEFSAGNSGTSGNGTSSYAVRGAGEFSLGSIPFMLEGSYSRWGYQHNCTSTSSSTGKTTFGANCYVTPIGGMGYYPLGQTQLYDQNADVRFAVRVIQPRIYIGVGYIWMSNSYGYPNMNSWGFGGEKLPDLNQPLSFFGSIWYYPNVKGTYTNVSTAPIKPLSYDLAYNVLKYQIGLDWVIGNSPIFIDLGWMGENWSNKTNAPIGRTYNGPFAGIGFRILYP
ncbi:MAG: copper amine oxidase N-terminal domain-containing protein [Candidatus Eremiobacteraeota bacterium]|nr:copper amine oxidase N-terminal domain-containing protein [Candidatus Eremiobacteraeota bacterium]